MWVKPRTTQAAQLPAAAMIEASVGCNVHHTKMATVPPILLMGDISAFEEASSPGQGGSCLTALTIIRPPQWVIQPNLNAIYLTLFTPTQKLIN